MTIVLVDGPSFHYYRVTATYSWLRHQKGNFLDCPELDSETVELFKSHLLAQYDKCIKKFTDTFVIPVSDMLFIRDCPREEIWRRKVYSKYKSNRDQKMSDTKHTGTKFGSYIKFLNESKIPLYKKVVRVPEAEADDVIAILASYFKYEKIIIITCDSDLNQLISERVTIVNPKNMSEIQLDNPADELSLKIKKGDPSDNITSCGTANWSNPLYRRNRQLIEFGYIPRYIQDRVVHAVSDLSYKNYPTWMEPKNLQLGLCCLNTELREKKPPVFCSRSCIVKTVEQKGLCVLEERITENCKDMIKMIKWNASNGIRVFRISSDLCPHKSNPKVLDYSLDFVQPLLEEAGNLARKYKQRITFHPGQYNVVGTPHEDKFQQTCIDLSYHAEILDRMCMDQDSVMVVHGGGLYGDKEKTIERWIANFRRLPEPVKARLVLENCEKCFNVEDCLKISEEVNIPVVLDTHHFECYNILHPDNQVEHDISYYIPAVLDTWSRKNIKPKFHVSEQAKGFRVGKHSDFIEVLPSYLTDITVPVDIMIEAKMKEQAIFKLYSKYPSIDPRIPKKKKILKKYS